MLDYFITMRTTLPEQRIKKNKVFERAVKRFLDKIVKNLAYQTEVLQYNSIINVGDCRYVYVETQVRQNCLIVAVDHTKTLCI